MARQRRNPDQRPQIMTKKPPKIRRHRESSDEDAQYSTAMRNILMFSCIIVAFAVCFKGYLETRVNTRFDNKRMVEYTGLEVPEQYWGTYRPGVYFGMKTRDPESLSVGLMWFFPRLVSKGVAGLRHWCEQSDDLKRYIWTQHDGRNFGVQEIDDGPYRLETSFVKIPGGQDGGDWTARISVSSDDAKVVNDEVALIFYVALDEKTDGRIRPYMSKESSVVTGVDGLTGGLGSFNLRLIPNGEVLSNSYLSTRSPGLNFLTNLVIDTMRVSVDKVSKKKLFILPGEVNRGSDGNAEKPNFIALQVIGKLPFELSVLYESSSFENRSSSVVNELYTQELTKYRDNFSEKFENIFRLKEKGWNDNDILVAKSALSNMLGSVGYFYGASQVKSAQSEGVVPYWKAPLYTAVPSRSFFPRGFLWDDAFHGLLLSTWDISIEMDIIHHWFDLMNIEGWIPREQILGVESLSKVPEEFVVQVNTNANPPVFFLTLRYIVSNYGEKLRAGGRLGEIDRLFPRLQAWFDWFNTTQIGELPGTYRWRGRSSETNKELNPKTLTSGLDDYPRATHPNFDERHVDLRCWMAVAAATMSDIADLTGRDGSKYAATYSYLSDFERLNELHWSASAEQYADFGLHTDDVELRRVANNQHGRAGQSTQNGPLVRVTLKQPTLHLVDTSFGYVSLFPFLLQLLPADSHQLEVTLHKLDKPDLLWTPYGLRSLATTSPFYQKHNTEHDPPYWRGAVWINMNYLAIKALKYYSEQNGPFKEMAYSLYGRLRQNVITNIIGEYHRSGFFWEQYNDKTGYGQGCRPFTGWTALFVMLMAEKY